MRVVPTVDISPLRRPGGAALSAADLDLEAIDRACADHGFFLLSGHGLDDLVAETFGAARSFFNAPHSTKDAIRRSADNALGYNERELTKRVRDHKEVFDFVDPSEGRAKHYNRWPADEAPFDAAGFQAAMVRYYDAFSELAALTTEVVLAAMGCSPSVAETHRGDRTTSSARLNHYTLDDPVPADERGGLARLGDVALGHHTDLGVLTLLLQDDVGGLQAHSRDDGWIDVDPEPGTIVVNLADSMQVWTNDRYRAAVHRVLPMTTSTRMSIPYFYNPPRDAMIEPISEIAGASPLYRPFTFRDHVDARTADNFADAGAADTQISDYLVDPATACETEVTR